MLYSFFFFLRFSSSFSSPSLCTHHLTTTTIMRVRQIGTCFVVIMVMLHIMTWVCATSRPIATTHVSFLPGIKSPQPAEESYMKPILKPNEKKEVDRGRRIGSKPPSCEKKCYGCEPCEAIQVPTISSIPHLSPHYANYQPEGWRCHCSP